MKDPRIVIGLDVKPSRVNAVLVDPAFGISLGQLSFPPYRTVEAIEDEITDWQPFSTGLDFILALCPDDPWDMDCLKELKQRWSISAQSSLRVTSILKLSSVIHRRSLKSQRASLLAFLARWNVSCHSDGILARAWALHLVRDQFFHVQTDEWPDFLYDDISGEPLYTLRQPLFKG